MLGNCPWLQLILAFQEQSLSLIKRHHGGVLITLAEVGEEGGGVTRHLSFLNSCTTLPVPASHVGHNYSKKDEHRNFTAK